MISAPDRKRAVELIKEAHVSGLRLHKACCEVKITLRTYERWTKKGKVKIDCRLKSKRKEPMNKLSAEERSKVLEICHKSEYSSLPPSQIVPRLLDKGKYIASESTFYRILREAGECRPRGRARASRKHRTPTTHCASAPCEVWSWDITWLPGPALGVFYYLYLILDIYSRKVVGWEVYERESAEHSAELVHRTVIREHCINKPLVLHADNGSPQKGSTLLVKLNDLGIEPSYSRPRVSNDNPYSEAIFRTCKYRPNYPSRGFKTIEEARIWVMNFVQWYNEEHRHSGIKFVTPGQRHRGEDKHILSQRKAVYKAAKARTPERWKGKIKNLNTIGNVWLNPCSKEKDKESLLKTA